jgi:hypothetical protein
MANPFGHGGERRTAQIQEFYKNNGYTLETLTIKSEDSPSLFSLFNSFLIVYRVYGFNVWSSFKRLLYFVWVLSKSLNSLNKFFSMEAEYFVWESTLESFYYLQYIAQKNGKKVIAYPQNIESLVSGQKSSMNKKRSVFPFRQEVMILNNSFRVKSISRIDKHILELFGVDSDYFPYQPPKEVMTYLSYIKSKRLSRVEHSDKTILILGTIHNPPTRKGMENLISCLNNCQLQNKLIIIAGFGTQSLQSIIDNERIVLKGEVSSKILGDLMIQCDALLVNQPATTGALTRITEFLIAGIPVIVNSDAAHSHYEFEGITFYNSDGELLELLDVQSHIQ